MKTTFLLSLATLVLALGSCDTPDPVVPSGDPVSLPLTVAPSGLVAQPAKAKVTLNWTPVPEATVYHIYRSLSATTLGAKVSSTDATTFTDTGLANGTEYFYTVTAVSPKGESATTSVLKAAPSLDRADLAHGADLGWVTWLEAAKGVTWSDDQGTVTAPETLLVGLGLDSVRLRVMVNPSPSTGVGYTDTASVVAAAKRFKAGGLTRLLVDFHLSDTWADPAHQNVPSAWKDDDLGQLSAHVAGHVKAVLTALQAEGITPEWVQVGNEKTAGILWPNLAKVTGSYKQGDDASGWGPLAQVLNAGYDAVKSFNAQIQVIVHIDKGGRSSLYQWWFDNYKLAGGKWDITGLSFYPY